MPIGARFEQALMSARTSSGVSISLRGSAARRSPDAGVARQMVNRPELEREPAARAAGPRRADGADGLQALFADFRPRMHLRLRFSASARTHRATPGRLW